VNRETSLISSGPYVWMPFSNSVTNFVAYAIPWNPGFPPSAQQRIDVLWNLFHKSSRRHVADRSEVALTACKSLAYAFAFEKSALLHE
jgi:hypothetical protein